MQQNAHNNPSWQSYLLWLGDRGLAYPSIRPVTQGTQVVGVEAEVETTIASHPLRELRLLAVSAAPLTAEERTLLSKMIAAMGLTPDQTMIEDSGTPSQSPLLLGVAAELILVLGPQAGCLFDLDPAAWSGLTGRVLTDQRASLGLLLITHPSDLIRQPQGKRQAWSDLQLGMRSLGLPLQS